MYDLWTGTYSMNEGDASAISFNAGTKTLKSSIIDNWSNYYINAVSYGEHQTNYRSDHKKLLYDNPEIRTVIKTITGQSIATNTNKNQLQGSPELRRLVKTITGQSTASYEH